LLASLAREAIAEMQRAKPLMLSGRFAEIEVRRLLLLVREWLDQERKRNFFAVVAVEEKRMLRVGDLELSVRLDRVDEIDIGHRIVIDYKTSKPSVQALIGERPDEPQLPLYLAMTETDQQAIGVAFAAVKRGEMGFAALVRESDMLPGVKAFKHVNGCKQYSTWTELVTAWRENLTKLAAGFCAGDANVNPKNFPKTCEFCDMQLFCRIHESIAAGAMGPEQDND
ncbi:MAG TPA: PD-(D/E)XK nuclease family protein, partial [Nitrosomonas sp.]|nr:PD-(D/E)XK nuclease family protein [Nitrosomonas sp.]